MHTPAAAVRARHQSRRHRLIGAPRWGRVRARSADQSSVRCCAPAGHRAAPAAFGAQPLSPVLAGRLDLTRLGSARLDSTPGASCVQLHTKLSIRLQADHVVGPNDALDAWAGELPRCTAGWLALRRLRRPAKLPKHCADQVQTPGHEHQRAWRLQQRRVAVIP